MESLNPRTESVGSEFTFKCIILSVILTLILTSSTIYLGLKVGLTVSASIPAAVISMGVLGLFRRSSILEHNLVQTAASGGMALASGVIFCLPALVLLGIWQDFHYKETFIISLYGGILGVLFAIPFRKILMNDPMLHYPEGLAIGHVLKAKTEQKGNLRDLILGGIIGATVSFGQVGLRIFSESVEYWTRINNHVVGMGLGFSPVLMGAGFIVGGQVALVAFIGVLVGWGFGVPIASHFIETSDLSAAPAATTLWAEHIRFIGVGVLLVGGIFTFFSMIRPLIAGIRTSKSHLADLKTTNNARTERDIPYKIVFGAMILMCVPLYSLYKGYFDHNLFGISEAYYFGISATIVLYTLVAGFVFSIIGGYIVGLIGSSASPLSALAMGAILLVALILLAMLGGYSQFDNPDKAIAATTLAIIVGVIVICSTAITNDVIQDLKVGQIVGATPWKQQVMQLFGVLVSACIIPPIMQLLLQAYGIGDVLPREDMDITESLAAPQAQLMAAIANGVFTKDIPWHLLSIGGGIATVAMILDRILKSKKIGSFPVVALGLGIYLPLQASTPIILGGALAWIIEYQLKKARSDIDPKAAINHGYVISSGLIAGGAIVGIILAIPFVLAQSTEIFSIVGDNQHSLTMCLGTLVFVLISAWMMRALKHHHLQG